MMAERSQKRLALRDKVDGDILDLSLLQIEDVPVEEIVRAPDFMTGDSGGVQKFYRAPSLPGRLAKSHHP